jgi:nicotinate phosphoribosyltransferase
MVIKMSEAKTKGNGWIPTIKLSDVKGKHTGDKKMIELAKQVIGV